MKAKYKVPMDGPLLDAKGNPVLDENGDIQTVYYKPGDVREHPDIWILVEQGYCEAVDEECKAKVRKWMDSSSPERQAVQKASRRRVRGLSAPTVIKDEK